MRSVLHGLLILSQGLVVLLAWTMHPFQEWDAALTEVDVDRTFVLSTLLVIGMLGGTVAWVGSSRAGSALRNTYLALVAAQALLALLKWFPDYQW